MRQPREQILQLRNGDCFEILKSLPDNSIDAVVTDPPYGLNSKEPDMADVLKHWLAGDDAPVKGSGFMGKAWDKFVPGPAVWREVFRVLKPGGHLLSFFGSRTYDMGTLAIRLAGFEIRDQIMWVYGSGFPKSLNVEKTTGSASWAGWGTALKPAHEDICVAVKPDPDALFCVRQISLLAEELCLLTSYVKGAENLSVLSLRERKEGADFAVWDAGRLHSIQDALSDLMATWPLESVISMSWNTVLLWQKALGELYAPASMYTTKTRLSMTIDWKILKSWLSEITPATIIQAWTNSPGATCAAFNAALAFSEDMLKSTGILTPFAAAIITSRGNVQDCAHEPICIARKPLAGTVAANVLAYGTGGLNIDGCRIGDEGGRKRSGEDHYKTAPGSMSCYQGRANAVEGLGRWPANIVHDGSDEVLAAFPDAKGQQGALTGNEPSGKMGSANCYGKMDRRHEALPRIDSSKSAARFFYCAKASKADRNYGLSGDDIASSDLVGREEGSAGAQSPRAGAGRTTGSKNPHPTVKPVALMRWLVRLVTPPGGRVLDPFMGSGSTGVATALEGFRFTGIELDPQFYAVASERIYFARKEAVKNATEQPPAEV